MDLKSKAISPLSRIISTYLSIVTIIFTLVTKSKDPIGRPKIVTQIHEVYVAKPTPKPYAPKSQTQAYTPEA